MTATSTHSTLRAVALFTLVFIIMGAAGFALSFVMAASSIAFIVLFAGIGLLINLFTYFASAKLVLWSYRARAVTEQEAPDLHQMVREVAALAGIPKPKIAIMNEPQPNAFATGRNPKHAVVCYTTGILQLLTPMELRGVTAHELAHVKNHDTLVMTAAATVAAFFSYVVYFAMLSSNSRNRSAGSYIATWILAYFLSVIAAMLIRTFVSRRREYGADETGTRIIGDSTGLQNALLKLDYAVRGRPMITARDASAHLFIVNPLTNAKAFSALHGLFASHPPIQKRVERLRRLQ
jgi:heat shock protein HtpX